MFWNLYICFLLFWNSYICFFFIVLKLIYLLADQPANCYCGQTEVLHLLCKNEVSGKNLRYLFFCLQFGIYHGKVRSNVWKKFQQKLQIFFYFSLSVISTPLVLLSERILSSGEIFEYLALILPPNLEKPLCNLEASVIICWRERKCGEREPGKTLVPAQKL